MNRRPTAIGRWGLLPNGWARRRPTAAWTGTGSRPLVSYAVGTRGVGDDCAPSYTLSQGADYEGSFVKALLDKEKIKYEIVTPNPNTEEVRKGVPLPGLYPANAENKARYDAWRKAQKD